MFALAQHYGIPTRLLDWTWKPLVAVYFAAEPVARRRVPGVTVAPDAPFSVFALRGDVVPASHGLDTEIHLISVPTATNPNLHAQGGLFSLVQPRAADEDPLPTLETVLQRHEQAIAQRQFFQHQTYEDRFPLLIEFRVPSREARTALMLLAHMGVSGAAIYPGLAGASIALREHRFYQWADPGSRS
jgi:hypothetical protein